MSLVLFVREFNEDRMHSICKVVSCNDNQFRIGEQIRIDLTVDAGFGEMPEKELVGKTVSVKRLQPCEFIGVGVELCVAHGITSDEATLGEKK